MTLFCPLLLLNDKIHSFHLEVVVIQFMLLFFLIALFHPVKPQILVSKSTEFLGGQQYVDAEGSISSTTIGITDTGL